MSEPNSPTEHLHETGSAVFAGMVVQQTNMALMFLGQVPHPESGQRVRDLDAARMFIDQLEMLEVKTKGNLDKREEALLKQSLIGLRMAFVEAANQEPTPTAKQEPASASPATASAPTQPASTAASEPPPATEDADARKKFSKKY